MAFILEPGKYTIVSLDSGKTIGTTPAPSSISRRPIAIVDDSASTRETVFTIELVGIDPFRRNVYRIKLDKALVIIAGDSVVADGDIPKSEATLWIIESKGGYGYGFIPGTMNCIVPSLCWTLHGDEAFTPVGLALVPQTNSIPPYSIFQDDQLFKLNLVK